MNSDLLQKVGTITSSNGAEITAFDPASSRLFVVAGSIVEIQKIGSTGAITATGSFVTGFAPPPGVQAIPNSVATKNGIVAVAYDLQDTTTKVHLSGRVSFYNAATGAFINAVTVGALPDMLTFTPDGTKVLVANEGEPNSYGQSNSIDPEGSVSIINIAGGVASATVQTADFTSFNSQAAALKTAGVRIFGPGATVAQDLEPEYIAVSPDGLTAWVTLQENNAIATLDLATAKITNIAPLGAKNYNLPGNGIDASDRDLTASTGKIDIKNQPAFGLYQPDAIASFSIAGKAYYITANEGDARDYTGFAEESRVGAAGYALDPTLFPTATTLKQDANLGRLTATKASGDTDGDGDFDRIETFGARSFSIWDATGKQVYDSGDQLEKITATQVPTLFNSDGTAATFDSRSDNKGPEPEGVVIGVINNRTYAFIGLERTGDVIVYDVTTPSQPQFVQYLNTPEDLGVEGLTFISAQDSPTGKPLLITAAEVSKTVTAFEIAIEGGKTAVGTTFLGQKTFATGVVPTGAAGKIDGVDVPLGGLSGVTYDAAKNQYYAISDDRTSNARFYTFTLDPVTSDVTFTNVVQLKDASGKPFALNSLDPEGIALTPNGTVFISSEGEANPSVGRVSNPFVKEFSLTTGQEIRSLSVPTKFLPKVTDTNGNGVVDTGDTQTAGVRNNQAFESLTISPNQKTLYTATENALFLDGGLATLATGSRSRILQYNLVSGLPEKEYLYVTDPIAKASTVAPNFNDNGLVDLLAIDDRGTLLALERSFGSGVGNTIKIYEISLQGATDISTIDSLNSLTAAQLSAIAPTQKRLLLDLDSLKLPNSDGNHPTGTDNIEGIAFGPKLADGRQSIVLVSDNNFSATQFTQILTLGADLVPTALPTVETSPALLDNGALPFSQRADADDPAVYVNATDSAKSLVVTSVKNGGLRVYDLAGNLIQTINPSSPDVRYNNVDLQYGFTLGGQKVDIAVASDRNNDKLAIFKINPAGTGGNYLENITDTSAATIFQAAPFTAPFSASATSAYGLALYRSPVSNDYYAFTTRRQTGDVAQLKLVDKGNGKIGYELVRNFTVPSSTTVGASAQTEGIAADQETGLLYIGQEDVGIWKYNAEPTGGKAGTLIEKVKAEGGKNLTNDVEGLTIYYGKNGTGYLFASSQGDNTFAAYTREGSNDYIGRFGVGSNGSIDSVQESDGAEVINLPLGANFPNGLFITQDGSNDPATIVDGENISSNFKFVPFENIANTFATPLKIDTTSYNPRNPVARLAVVESAFPNGVASGDTTQTSTVLWTRANVPGKVTFEYSTKSDFSSIAGTQTATVTNPLQPVKVDVTGLSANTNYFYRVTDVNGTKTNGKFSTAATIGQQTGLKFGVSGDWRGELAPYPAIANADTANLKFFVGLGDTIYGDVASAAVKNPDGTEKSQATTLADYRAKNAEVYNSRFGQNTWADLRASTSILATIDDHEVTNDFAGGESLATATAAEQALYGAKTGLINDSPLYENGLQAFQEFNPIRDLTYTTPGDARTDGERKLYRANTFGNDAATFVLDARSFRDKELADVTNLADQAQVGKFLVDAFDPKRTMLGKQQVDDLKRDLLQSQKDGVTWKFIMVPEPIQNIGVLAAADRFEGYAAERTEILKYVNDNKIENVVFVAADIHGTLVNNLTYQNAPGQAQIATSAFEITTGSVGYSQPFGQTVAQLGAALGVITPAQKAVYDSLPTAGKDTFIKGIVDGGLQPLGYDPLGLDKNLSQANGLINAKLLQGDYVATHVYGWTEFNIDKQTQKLTVTTYGIDPYTRAEVEANPAAITSRQPKIVSQFEVTPNNVAPTLVSGTAGVDNLVAGVTPGLDGYNDLVFTGAGNDTVDIPISGANAGNNRIDLGSGADVIDVANGDRVFGTGGDDTLDATDTKDYRISGGDGNDTLFLGANGRALGGNGNDKLFVGAGGGNFLSGGAGADQFWIANTELPSGSNTIVDFQIGTDVIGIQGAKSLGISATTIGLTQVGADTTINLGGQTLAVLIGIQATSLSPTNSSQFVFG
jgi:3-phytase